MLVFFRGRSFGTISSLSGFVRKLGTRSLVSAVQRGNCRVVYRGSPPSTQHGNEILTSKKMSSLVKANEDSMPRCLSDTRLDEAFSAHGQSGHRFSRKTFTRPSYCHHCTDMLWGLTNQGLICEGEKASDSEECEIIFGVFSRWFYIWGYHFVLNRGPFWGK